MYKAPCTCSSAVNKPLRVNVKKHCGHYSRISMNHGHTVQSCINLCKSKSNCQKVELGAPGGCCNKRCDLYTAKYCNPGYSSHFFDWYLKDVTPYSRKYTLERSTNGQTLATFTDQVYHLSSCSDKCTANVQCEEFSVKADGKCILYDKCPTVSSTGSVVSDHYKRVDCELVNKCDLDPNVITIPALNGWDTTIENETPTRSDTKVTIPGFDFSNPDCGLMFYEVLEQTDKTDVADGLVTLSGT